MFIYSYVGTTVKKSGLVSFSTVSHQTTLSDFVAICAIKSCRKFEKPVFKLFHCLTLQWNQLMSMMVTYLNMNFL